MAVGYGPRGGEFVHENEHAAAMDMEKVFFRLHSKLISSVTSFCTLGSLRLVEYMALANALVLLCVLLFLHANFVGAANSNNCVVKELQKRIGSMEEFDVVQVQVAGIWSHLANVDLDGAEAIQLAKVNGGVAARELVATWLTDPVFLYAKERGYLLLSPEARTKHGIRDLNISLSFDCVREKTPFVMFVLDNFVGYDTVMANTFIQAGNGEGYMYSRISRDFVDLNNISTGYGTDTRSSRNEYFAFKVGILVTTVFLFFISTTLVHHTLRETQQKMLEFTVELQRHIELGKPYHKLVLNHVANSVVFVPIMVGTLFFLFEFFNDQLLAFIVLALVWICELYSVITLRCKTSINTFPRLFFVYYASFHLYFFSFPTGFVYLALTTAIVFLHHGMLFFWGRFEIPAYLSGRISAQHPREGKCDFCFLLFFVYGFVSHQFYFLDP
mmetsp:Transcript_28051/g.44947  ORF Transcript_28051/g.44947 Transcript_28051/m.44947 type:complete len:443 (+) Transcript_28051:133-1461(+)